MKQEGKMKEGKEKKDKKKWGARMNKEKKERKIFVDLLKDALKKNGNILFTSKGGSMNPFLKDEQKIIIRKIGRKNITKGDIIIYKTNDWLLIHRVADIEKKGRRIRYIIKGDSLDDVTHVVERKKIVGIVKEKWYKRVIAKKGLPFIREVFKVGKAREVKEVDKVGKVKKVRKNKKGK